MGWVFAWGTRGDVPTHPHASPPNMRGEMRGVNMGCLKHCHQSTYLCSHKHTEVDDMTKYGHEDTYDGYDDSDEDHEPEDQEDILVQHMWRYLTQHLVVIHPGVSDVT